MTCIQFKDTISLVSVTTDAYGGDVVDEIVEVKAAIDLNTGYIHGANQDNTASDAIAYLDPTDEFISDNYYRLEEMILIIDLFGTPERKAWYKITQVNVARDTQLCNDIDHIEVLLKKTSEVFEIS
jgi:hypothetical protein